MTFSNMSTDGKQSGLRGAIRIVFCLAGAKGDAIPFGGIEGRQPSSGCRVESPALVARARRLAMGTGAKRPVRVEGRQPRPVK